MSPSTHDRTLEQRVIESAKETKPLRLSRRNKPTNVQPKKKKRKK